MGHHACVHVPESHVHGPKSNRIESMLLSCIMIAMTSLEQKRVFASHSNINGQRLGAGYSPDGKYVACGADDGSICVYDAYSGAVTVPALKGHIGPVFDLKWNPQRHLLGSIHANTIFWMPSA